MLQIFVRESFFTSIVGINIDRNRVGHCDAVSDFDKHAVAESVLYKGFGYPSYGVSSRSIDFRWVFARESSASMATPTSVGVNNDLTSSKPRVPSRSADDESSRRVYIINRIFINVLGWNYVFDDLFFNGSFNFFIGNGLSVLYGK